MKNNRQDYLFLVSSLLVAFYSVIAILSVFLPTIFELPKRINLNFQFPLLLGASILLMYQNMFLWIFLKIASLFYRPTNKNSIAKNKEIPVSVLIAARNEEKVISNIINDLLKQDYNNFEIIVIANNCTDKTVSVARNFSDSRLKVIEFNDPKGGTKASALNRGLKEAKGEIIAIFDADNRIEDQNLIKKAVSYFEEENVVGVQTKIISSNGSFNLLTTLQDIEFENFNEVVQKGRQVLNKSALLAGTGMFLRKTTLLELNGWPHSLVEDYELSVLLSLKQPRKKIVYGDNLAVKDEKVVNFSSLIKQRARWIKGYLKTSCKYIGDFNSFLDYWYRLTPFSILGWWISILLFIFYHITGQTSLVVLPAWLWLGWNLLFLTIVFQTLTKKIGWRSVYYIFSYWIYSFHIVIAGLYSLFLTSWSEAKTEHHGTNVKNLNNQSHLKPKEIIFNLIIYFILLFFIGNVTIASIATKNKEYVSLNLKQYFEKIDYSDIDYSDKKITGLVLYPLPFPYKTPEAFNALENLLELKSVNYVQLRFTLYQDGPSSSQVSYNKENDLVLESMINMIHQKGKKVSLMPTIHFMNQEGIDQGIHINPTDPKEWFNSYFVCLKHYAQLAQKEEVEMFVIGNELTNLFLESGDQRYWERLIDILREIFSGILTVKLNSWYQIETFNKILETHWLSKLDLIGVAAYFDLVSSFNPSENELKNAWFRNRHGLNIVEELETIAEKFNKQIVFLEIGYRSCNGNAIEPWNNNNLLPSYSTTPQPVSLNYEEQLKAYRILLDTFNRNWFKGVIWFYWPTAQNPQSTLWDIWGKPVEKLFD